MKKIFSKLIIFGIIFMFLGVNNVLAKEVSLTEKDISESVKNDIKEKSMNLDKIIKYYQENLDIKKYKALNPDLVEAFGKDADDSLYIKHYLEFGIKEGRNIGEIDVIAIILNNYDLFMENGLNPDFKFFDVESYKGKYEDLQLSFGDDLGSYLKHYIQFGIFENRTFRTTPDKVDLVELKKKIEDVGGIDYFRSNEDISFFDKIVNTFISNLNKVKEIKDDNSDDSDDEDVSEIIIYFPIEPIDPIPRPIPVPIPIPGPGIPTPID